MGTIGIFDWDFMNYEHVIPNLECAKLCTYFHNKHEIAVLAPYLEPARYTNFFVRKEYNDGMYPKTLFAPNCEYGGRAFNPQSYSALAPEIERVIPNMHLYDKYSQHFGTGRLDERRIKHILNCAHIRLSTDEQTPLRLNQLKRILDTGRYTGIIFHDYDLARIPNSYDIIYELSQTREFKTKSGINPYAIGNKFPIQVSSPQELDKWLKIVSMPNLFCLQYNGFMPDSTLNDLCLLNSRMARQVYYLIDASCSDENDFLLNILPKIFIQVLFLRKQGIKILLKYSQEKIITPELQNLIDLLNCWLSFSWHTDFLPTTQSLYTFCASNKRLHYQNWAFLTVTVDIDQQRDSFQFIREKNYDLFKMFYEWDLVIFEGGQFIDGWRRH